MDRKSFSITRYAIQSFRHYGGKSIVLMIILASTLVLALLNIMTSIQGTYYAQSVSIGGDAQFRYINVTPEQIETVKNQKQVDWTSEYVSLRNLTAIKIQNPDRYAVNPIYMENLIQMDGFKIVEGNPPQKENEVAIPKVLAEYLGIEAEIGAEFELNLIKSSVEVPAKFIVSGIIEDNSYFELGVDLGYNYVMFVSKEFVLAHTTLSYTVTTEYDEAHNNEYDRLDLYVKLKKGYEAEKVAEEIADVIGVDSENIHYNNFYLSASLNDRDTGIVFYVIIGFFAVVGTLMIYNAFNIIIAKRTRHFGLLTLIGASKKQIRKCVYIEAILNTVIALPVGLLLGTFSSWLAIPIVYSSYSNASTIFSVNPRSYLLTILITLIMVMAGALIPAKRAEKITPVEAAKFMPNSKKINKVKNLKNITIPSLAHVNLFRKKSGVSGIIMSMSIVGVLFMSISLILFSIYDSLDSLAKRSMAADVSVHQGVISGGYIYSDFTEIVFPPDVVDTIINLDGVKESKILYMQYYEPPDNKTEYGLGGIFGVNDIVMQEIIDNTYEKEGFLNLSDLKGNVINVIAVRNSYYNENGSVKYHVGQDITVKLFSYTDSELNREVTLHVAGIIDTNNIPPYGIYSGYIEDLIIPQSSFEANDFELQCQSIFLDIDDSKHDSITESLEQICDYEGNIRYESYQNLKKYLESQMMSGLVLVMMGLGIVFLVSILNLVSTTFIGIEQRKKEFGVLSALGMEHKELKKMLKWEGLWVSVISSIISISGGLIMGSLLYVWIVNLGGDYIELSIPVIPIIIFCITYVFTPYIISTIAIRKFMKNTTVELIGQEI